MPRDREDGGSRSSAHRHREDALASDGSRGDEVEEGVVRHHLDADAGTHAPCRSAGFRNRPGGGAVGEGPDKEDVFGVDGQRVGAGGAVIREERLHRSAKAGADPYLSPDRDRAGGGGAAAGSAPTEEPRIGGGHGRQGHGGIAGGEGDIAGGGPPAPNDATAGETAGAGPRDAQTAPLREGWGGKGGSFAG